MQQETVVLKIVNTASAWEWERGTELLPLMETKIGQMLRNKIGNR